MSRGSAAVEIGRSTRGRHVSEKREVNAGIRVAVAGAVTSTVANAQHRSCWSQEHIGTFRGRFADLCRACSVAEARGWRALGARGAPNRPQRLGRCLNRRGVVGLQRALSLSLSLSLKRSDTKPTGRLSASYC